MERLKSRIADSDKELEEGLGMSDSTALYISLLFELNDYK